MLTQRVELGCVGEYRNDGARDAIISGPSLLEVTPTLLLCGSGNCSAGMPTPCEQHYNIEQNSLGYNQEV